MQTPIEVLNDLKNGSATGLVATLTDYADEIIADVFSLADAEAKIATLTRERDEWRESWANRRDLADNLTEKLIEAEAKIETLTRELASLRREIVEAGNSREDGTKVDFDWSVLARLDRLESAEEALAASQAREERLRAALTALYNDTADYVRVNNLGDVHHNESMRLARAALAETATTKPIPKPESE